MTNEQMHYSYLALLILVITVPFLLVEALIWAGTLSIPALGNLANGGTIAALFENPAFVGLIAVMLDGVLSGFMRNALQSKEKFDFKQFGETFFYYEPLLILVSQFFPIKYSFVLVFVVRVVKLAIEKILAAQKTA